ncbi:hypothetical protein FisN_7Lh072 [Fistulifera solaris]|uniref:Protein kinase domain-containing protein n=1 Tax=Fistulifera solaris TaxID=1519565 RepID=A0A1Z5JCT6_FISSO|nr:hypothetical protein FisN_7Lh072 [Fistulifera solaris]|eukprot:GAX11702.1 hypothetical protein FisN_7Lh072 [Fistulifera solaris]
MDHQSSSDASEETSQPITSLLEVAAQAKECFTRDFYDPTTNGITPSVPIFHGDEVVVSKDPVYWSHHTADHELRTIRIVMDLQSGSFGKGMEHARSRFADRSIDGHFVLRSLQPPLSEDTVIDWVTEVYMLTAASPKHPHILQAYGMQKDENTLLSSGRTGAFLIVDRVVEMLPDRIDSWRRSAKGLHERLEIAMDVASAIAYLHCKKIVYHLTPSKVGFDSRYGRIKLCQFRHARHVHSQHFPRSLQQSDDVRRVLPYAAPEVYSGIVSSTSDVYAFGIMLWEMVTLKIPFRRCSSRAELYYRTVTQQQRPELDPYDWSSSLIELVTSAWDPIHRPAMKALCDILENALLFSGDEHDNAKHDSGRTRGTLDGGDSKNGSFVTVGTSGVYRDTDEENEVEEEEEKRDSVTRSRSAGDTPPSQNRRPPPPRTVSADGSFRTPAPRRKKISTRASPAPQSASAVEERKLKLSRSPDSSKGRDETTLPGQALKTPRRGSRKLPVVDMRTPDSRNKDVVEMGMTPRRSPGSGRVKEKSESEHVLRRSAPQRSSHESLVKATRRASEDLSTLKLTESTLKATSKAPRRQSEFYNTSYNGDEQVIRPTKGRGRSTGRAFSERDIFQNRLSSRDNAEPKTPRNRRPSGSHIAALLRSKSPSKSPSDKTDRQAQRSRSFSNQPFTQPSITPNSKSSGDLKSLLSSGSSDKAKVISDASLAEAVGNLRI